MKAWICVPSYGKDGKEIIGWRQLKGHWDFPVKTLPGEFIEIEYLEEERLGDTLIVKHICYELRPEDELHASEVTINILAVPADSPWPEEIDTYAEAENEE